MLRGSLWRSSIFIAMLSGPLGPDGRLNWRSRPEAGGCSVSLVSGGGPSLGEQIQQDWPILRDGALSHAPGALWWTFCSRGVHHFAPFEQRYKILYRTFVPSISLRRHTRARTWNLTGVNRALSH